MGDWEGVEGGGEAVAVRMGGDSWILKLLPASPRGWILALRRQGPARRERYNDPRWRQDGGELAEEEDDGPGGKPVSIWVHSSFPISPLGFWGKVAEAGRGDHSRDPCLLPL